MALETVSERDLLTLAGIISDHRDDLGAYGLPQSLLVELTGQIRCDVIEFESYDSERQQTLFVQYLPGGEDVVVTEDWNALHWQHYWDCQPCSYPDRTGDLRSIVKPTDFYSTCQWHSTGMYWDMYRPWGNEHDLMLTLPAAPSPAAGAGRTARLFFYRGPARIFPSATGRCWYSCDRTCTRPTSTPNAAGHTNTQIPPPRHHRGNRPHPPANPLRQAERLQPHRRRHPRLPRRDHLS